MARIVQHFPTSLYSANAAPPSLRKELTRAALLVAADDRAGQRWSRAHGYAGYTSYASLDDLPMRASAFAALTPRLARHAALFARELGWDLQGRALRLESLWINVLERGGAHSAHLHPNSVLSGTLYLQVPRGAGAIRFEDPRLASLMAAPPLMASAPQRFVEVAPRPGQMLMWESFLRHEVLPNRAAGQRISLSFNFAWP